jgi:glutamate mutase epsilon subunit
MVRDETRASTVISRQPTITPEVGLTGIIFKDPVRAAQYTHCVSVIKTIQLMLQMLCRKTLAFLEGHENRNKL